MSDELLPSEGDGTPAPADDTARSFPIRPGGPVEARPLPPQDIGDAGDSQSPAPIASRDFDGPDDPHAADAHAQDTPPDPHIALLLRDGLDAPIAGLDLFVNWPDGTQCAATTSADGLASVRKPPRADGPATVEVVDTAGRRQAVCTLDTTRCKGVAVIRSPKVMVQLPLREHQPMRQRAHSSPPTATHQPTHQSTHHPMPPTTTGPAQPKNPHAAPAAQPLARATGPAPASSAAQASQHPGPWWFDNGAVERAWDWLKAHVGHASPPPPPRASARIIPIHTLNRAGQPLTVVPGAECPNRDNLRLGRNNVYREALLQAARRVGLMPQALCALIDCEAARVAERIPVLDAKGVPVRDKKGRPVVRTIRELWNANSGNAETNAAGLTQFLRGTWLGHVLKPGHYIHDRSVEAGWVASRTVESGRAKGVQRWVFVLSDGRTTDRPDLHLKDEAVRACLAKRMDPTWSVLAAADYGRANLSLLVDAGFKLEGLCDMDRAKLMYVMHHEGEWGGPKFVSNELEKVRRGGVAALRGVFAQQIGSARANKLVDQAGGDVEVAYRNWLAGYVDGTFNQSDRFFCSHPTAVTALTKLLVRIGGVAITQT